jgi:hypothetical protein
MSTKRTLSALLLAATVMLGVLAIPSAASASDTSATKIGAWSKNWSWFDQAVGAVDVYRGYDNGFRYPTWQQVPSNLNHARVMNPSAMNDYSFRLPPAEVAAGVHDAKLRTFIASTPKNIVLTNHHEPEQEIQAGQYTFAQFRRANVRLNQLVDEQNAADGGTRKVSIILMVSTFQGFQGRNPENYWPTAAKGDSAACLSASPVPCTGTVDLISADVYAAPHATGTAGVPLGYTDGVNWKTPATLMVRVMRFAQAHGNADWAVSELGYLEDVNNPQRRAQALQDAVNVARTGVANSFRYKPALWISYWDSRGGRADWGLRFDNPPVPSESMNSNAAVMWRQLRALP